MTFGAIKTRIADELVRPDLASQIALAVQDAMAEASGTRFWFNEVRGLTFTMTPGQMFYDATTLADISYLSDIDALWILVNGQRRNMEPRNALDIESWLEGSTTLRGQPAFYARQANGLVFWMPPNLAFPVYIDGVTDFAPLVNDADSNPYLVEGERYVRALAKARLLEDVIRDFDEADRQWAMAERQRQQLVEQSCMRVASNSMAANW